MPVPLPSGNSGTGSGRSYGEYRIRSACAAALTCQYPWTEKETFCDTEEKVDFIKKYTEEYLKVRPYFSEDFYPLTELSEKPDVWCAMQFNRPGQNDGIIEVFRRENAPYETASEIVLNNSWSGSTICNTGYNGDCSKSSSFIFRLTKLIDEGFFSKNKIDRVFIFGATNDSWTGNTAGKLIFDKWAEDDLKLVLPRISYFIKKLLEVVPQENICFIVNTNLREEIREGILKICDHYNVNYITLSDIEKIEGHPTYQGMISIKNQVISNLNRPCN